MPFVRKGRPSFPTSTSSSHLSNLATPMDASYGRPLFCLVSQGKWQIGYVRNRRQQNMSADPRDQILKRPMSKYVVRLETKIGIPLLRNDLFDFHFTLSKSCYD